MKNIRLKNENGSVDSWMILAICFIIVSISVSIFAIWSFTSYLEQKKDVDSKIKYAVAAAKKEQSDADEVSFSDREKRPTYSFIGPEDYGSVSFQYPKTWSWYEEQDAIKGGDYVAYLDPGSIPPLIADQVFALKVIIRQEVYDDVVSSFDGLVQEGKLSSSSIKTADGVNSGVRFTGTFADNLRGSLIIFKIRDKTLTIRTYADTFLSDPDGDGFSDFDIILNSINFIQ